MTSCDYCGKDIDLPFKCKFCGGIFCSSHRLPEAHECTGLEEYKERSKGERELIYEPFRPQISSREESNNLNLFSSIFGILSRNVYILIISICVLVFLLQAIPGFSEFFYMTPELGQLIQGPWRVVTSIFLHGGSFHLFVNMLVLFFFGGELERRVGSKKFLEIFLLSGVVANLGFTAYSYATSSFTPALGASGAIFGVFAALAIIAPEIRVLIWFVFPLKIRHALILFALWDVFLLPYGGPIANSAHLSGLVLGVLYGFKLKGEQKKSFLENLTG
jgi:hypothetical protein